MQPASRAQRQTTPQHAKLGRFAAGVRLLRPQLILHQDIEACRILARHDFAEMDERFPQQLFVRIEPQDPIAARLSQGEITGGCEIIVPGVRDDARSEAGGNLHGLVG